MEEKYRSSRKVETREYYVGDNVSIYIPKRLLKDYHVLLPINAVEDSLVINY